MSEQSMPASNFEQGQVEEQKPQGVSVSAYQDFLAKKSQLGGEHGFEPVWLPPCLLDFQQSLADWCLRRGVGVELKESYFRQARKNIQAALQANQMPDLFGGAS